MKKFLKLMVFLAIVAIVTGLTATLVEVFSPPVVIEGPIPSIIEVSQVFDMGQYDSYQWGECQYFYFDRFEEEKLFVISERDGDGYHTLPFYISVEGSKIPWIIMKVSISCSGEKGDIYIR